jgi:hypothetical protein
MIDRIDSQEILAVGRLSMHKAFVDSVRGKWEAGMLERSQRPEYPRVPCSTLQRPGVPLSTLEYP